MAEAYISVGKLGKPHGLSGAFRFLLNDELKSKKKVPKHFIIEERGSFLPWFISKIEWLGFNDGFISFEEITSVEKAKEHTKKELLLSQKDFELYFKKTSESLGYLVGYKATDEKHGALGVIDEITEHPGQLLCTIKNGKEELTIPFVEDFIVTIDKRKKEIIFSLPEGLLDL
jgi:16S rRNA processing protein RimM